jgi:DNA topoisomerase-1
LDKCDFTPIWEWHLKEDEKKKSLTKEEKKVIKEEKEKIEKKYIYCVMNGKKEKVANFRIEPPVFFI